MALTLFLPDPAGCIGSFKTNSGTISIFDSGRDDYYCLCKSMGEFHAVPLDQFLKAFLLLVGRQGNYELGMARPEQSVLDELEVSRLSESEFCQMSEAYLGSAAWLFSSIESVKNSRCKELDIDESELLKQAFQQEQELRNQAFRSVRDISSFHADDFGSAKLMASDWLNHPNGEIDGALGSLHDLPHTDPLSSLSTREYASNAIGKMSTVEEAIRNNGLLSSHQDSFAGGASSALGLEGIGQTEREDSLSKLMDDMKSGSSDLRESVGGWSTELPPVDVRPPPLNIGPNYLKLLVDKQERTDEHLERLVALMSESHEEQKNRNTKNDDFDRFQRLHIWINLILVGLTLASTWLVPFVLSWLGMA